MHTDPDLLLGRALIAATWADGQLDPGEREALQDLFLAIDGISPDTWQALHADLHRPFTPEHRERLFAELDEALREPRIRARARELVEQLQHRLPAGSAEEQVLAELLPGESSFAEAKSGAPTGKGIFSRLGQALSGGLAGQAGQIRRKRDESDRWEVSLRERLKTWWPGQEAIPDDQALHRLCIGAAILAHVVRLDDAIDPGEQEALHEVMTTQWGLSPAAAKMATELILDETAGGLDLHLLLREFYGVTTEEERKRFLAAVFRVAAGDGRATYDEIEEVRRIGRGLLLSHQHFIEAKLSLPPELRDT